MIMAFFELPIWMFDLWRTFRRNRPLNILTVLLSVLLRKLTWSTTLNARTWSFSNLRQHTGKQPSLAFWESSGRSRVRYISDFLGVDCPVVDAYMLGRFHAQRPRLKKFLCYICFCYVNCKTCLSKALALEKPHPWPPFSFQWRKERLILEQAARRSSSIWNRSSFVTSEISKEVSLTQIVFLISVLLKVLWAHVALHILSSNTWNLSGFLVTDCRAFLRIFTH